MGNYLTAPNCVKAPVNGGIRTLRYGASSMQGWRLAMEDAHIALMAPFPNIQNVSMFGVFDGHGGPQISKFAEAHILEEIQKAPAFAEGNLAEAMSQAFLAIDQLLFKKEYQHELESFGCIAVPPSPSETKIDANLSKSHLVAGSGRCYNGDTGNVEENEPSQTAVGNLCMSYLSGEGGNASPTCMESPGISTPLNDSRGQRTMAKIRRARNSLLFSNPMDVTSMRFRRKTVDKKQHQCQAPFGDADEYKYEAVSTPASQPSCGTQTGAAGTNFHSTKLREEDNSSDVVKSPNSSDKQSPDVEAKTWQTEEIRKLKLVDSNDDGVVCMDTSTDKEIIIRVDQKENSLVKTKRRSSKHKSKPCSKKVANASISSECADNAMGNGVDGDDKTNERRRIFRLRGRQHRSKSEVKNIFLKVKNDKLRNQTESIPTKNCSSDSSSTMAPSSTISVDSSISYYPLSSVVKPYSETDAIDKSRKVAPPAEYEVLLADDVPSCRSGSGNGSAMFQKSDASTGSSGSGILSSVKGVVMNILSAGRMSVWNSLLGRTYQPISSLAMLAGCTSIVTLVTDTQIIIANAGDSRAVLCRGAQAVDLSVDHKPNLPNEKSRIYYAGGYLEMGRVNGNLNLSRAIGDLVYKSDLSLPPDRQIVISKPDLNVFDIQEDDEFMVIGCDGIWEKLYSSQYVVNFVRLRIDSAEKLSDIVEELFEELLSPNPAIFEYGCDNMSAIIVDLKPLSRSSFKTPNSDGSFTVGASTNVPSVSPSDTTDAVIASNGIQEQHFKLMTSQRMFMKDE